MYSEPLAKYDIFYQIEFYYEMLFTVHIIYLRTWSNIMNICERVGTHGIICRSTGCAFMRFQLFGVNWTTRAPRNICCHDSVVGKPLLAKEKIIQHWFLFYVKTIPFITEMGKCANICKICTLLAWFHIRFAIFSYTRTHYAIIFHANLSTCNI